MMENKCNKTPNKYLDHVYCQSGENKNYMRPSNNSGGGSTGADLLALLKENKQLKAMLILHLDLIQEQSDQLAAKDKQLSSLKEELQTIRSKNLQLEGQVQELQIRQIKRAAAPSCELALLSPPPLAKIQCKKDGNSVSPTNIIGECNGKLISKIILQRVNIDDGSFVDSTHSPNSTTTISDSASEEATIQKDVDDDEEEIEELTSEESNDETPLTPSKDQETETQQSLTVKIPRGAKPKPRRALDSEGNTAKVTTPASTPVQVCVTPPTPRRGKQMPLMLWHAPHLQSEDDSGSCESAPDVEKQPSTPLISPISQPKSPIVETPKAKKRTAAQSAQQTARQTQRQSQNQQQQQSNQKQHTHKRRCPYITTSQKYATREWEDEEETVCDYEFSQAEAEALYAEAPMLEIPKWTEHDLSPLYCIEGTEDLSDELFLKRHSKLEVDEKRRKKWDVQQIREQRRVEKLKRRHYKNDVQPSEQQTLKSFYPQLENLQSICYVSELPVQAFGEMIPKINSNNDFRLPWLQNVEPLATTPTVSTTTPQSSVTIVTVTTTPTTSGSVEIMANSTASGTSTQVQQQLSKSTFVFLKKRKRQQSSSAGATMSSGAGVSLATSSGGTARQRTLAATKATVAVATVSAPTATSTTITTTTVAPTTTENPTNIVEKNK